MWQLATAFIDIALRRRGPETLPDSSFLLIALIVLHLPLGLVVRALLGDVSTADLVFFLWDTILYFAFVFAILRFFKFERRYRQTMSALLGVEILVNFVFIPLGVIALIFDKPLGDPPLLYVYLLIVFWWILVAAFILGRALAQPLIVGLMFVLLYLLTQLSINDLLQPESTESTESADDVAALEGRRTVGS